MKDNTTVKMIDELFKLSSSLIRGQRALLEHCINGTDGDIDYEQALLVMIDNQSKHEQSYALWKKDQEQADEAENKKGVE
jgi:hypothetical protein